MNYKVDGCRPVRGVCLPAFEEATRVVLVSVFLIPTF